MATMGLRLASECPTWRTENNVERGPRQTLLSPNSNFVYGSMDSLLGTQASGADF